MAWQVTQDNKRSINLYTLCRLGCKASFGTCSLSQDRLTCYTVQCYLIYLYLVTTFFRPTIKKLITNRISQEQFQTVFLEITKKDLPSLNKKLWSFDWKKEIKLPNRVVYKLTTQENPAVIQGLISWSDLGDHIFINIVESAPFNRGKERLYQGVAGNLFAIACQESFTRGYDGFVVFESKTKLINHYRDLLGAQRLGSSIRMFVDSQAASHLIKLYL